MRVRVAAQSPAERIVIELIRGAAAGAGDTPFAALAREAAAVGMRILGPKAPFLTADEIALVGWIAYRQREWELSVEVAPAAIDDAAQACADVLTARNLRLAFLSVQRLSFLPGAAPTSATATQLPPGNGGLRARALSLVRGRPGVQARELRQAGISRQYLSRLCKAGILVRTGYGLYRAP